MIQFTAHFDGKNICPDEPVTLPENVPLRITVDAAATSTTRTNSLLDLFDRLENEVGLIDGPTDWAAEHNRLFSADHGKRLVLDDFHNNRRILFKMKNEPFDIANETAIINDKE